MNSPRLVNSRWLASLIVLAWPHAALAQQVSKPFTGVTVVDDPNNAMAIADLCAPGVSVRATKYAERKATPEQWATNPAVNAEVSVNADFFDFPGWTLVNGLARGAGEDWPLQGYESRHHFRFGAQLADLQPDTNKPPLAATEVVGCHNIIIQGGKSQAPNFDGDSVILTAHRRTAIGLSADRRALFLFASNASLDGAALAARFLQYAQLGGHGDVDVACNMDGGGSSQMFVRGRGQIVTSGRQVNNHLGILATGQGGAPMCPNAPPVGYLDSATCDGIAGWAQDPDEPTKVIDVHVYFDGAPGEVGAQALATSAGKDRPDLCKPLGSCNHGYALEVPLSLLDEKAHAVRAYGIDSKGGTNPLLAQSPKSLTCAPMKVSGVRRWIKNPATLAAWHLGLFADVMPVGDAVVNGLPDEGPLPDAPTLVRADDGSPEVWLVDGNAKQHVPSPEVAARWQFDLTKVVTWPKAKVAALHTAPPVRPRPIAIRGGGPAVYLVSDSLKSAPVAGPDAGTGDGGGGGDGGDGAAADDGGCSVGGGSSRFGTIMGAWLLAVALWRRRSARR